MDLFTVVNHKLFNPLNNRTGTHANTCFQKYAIFIQTINFSLQNYTNSRYKTYCGSREGSKETKLRKQTGTTFHTSTFSTIDLRQVEVMVLPYLDIFHNSPQMGRSSFPLQSTCPGLSNHSQIQFLSSELAKTMWFI